MKRDSGTRISSSKEEVRRARRQHLRVMDPAYRAEASLVICELAAQQPAFSSGLCIGLFAPLPTEPDIHPLIEESWARRKEVLLPRLWSEGPVPRLEWYAVTQWSEVTDSGPSGLREPNPDLCPRIDSARLDCLFIPGLAFDENGMRLGRGGGFYDRFLAETSSSLPRFGLMFSSQLVPQLPSEPHDQGLPVVITEDGLIRF